MQKVMLFFMLIFILALIKTDTFFTLLLPNQIVTYVHAHMHTVHFTCTWNIWLWSLCTPTCIHIQYDHPKSVWSHKNNILICCHLSNVFIKSCKLSKSDESVRKTTAKQHSQQQQLANVKLQTIKLVLTAGFKVVLR